MLEIITTALENPINLVIISAIGILAFLDIVLKKDLKSQIVSLGVLGTFIGIFIGLQDFNPLDMKNSINSILEGLKTAFFTSIAGMGVALILSVIQKVLYKDIDDANSNEHILLEISEKLNHLEKLNQTQETDKIIGELERLRTVQSDTRDETKKVAISIDELKINSNHENQKLISILDTNFEKMNNSLEIAIDKLSQGATEEIIKALETVIQEFNQELQSSFGDNFVKLNEAVINLLKWQENYKTHIETLDQKLELSTTSIEKSKESLEIISSKNEMIIKIYKALGQVLNKNNTQINLLNEELKTYGHLGNDARNMFSTIAETIDKAEKGFTRLSQSVERTTQEIKGSYVTLTDDIKAENIKQSNYNKDMFKDIRTNLDDTKKELDGIKKNYQALSIEIPQALQVSLAELNRGLTSLTTQFKKDYQEFLDKHKRGLE